MLFPTSQLEKLHGFEQDVVELKCKDKTLENVKEFKLLDITIDKTLNWKKHINDTTKNCYATLNVLRKIKRYTTLPVPSLLFYQNKFLFDIPKYMKQQLQKVQNVAAAFILNKYANI